MVRVDQAGEYGATRIYAGQLAVMGDRTPTARMINGMANQEERHRAFFDAMIARRGVRPTALQPFWNVAGFALGAVTAAIGPDAPRWPAPPRSRPRSTCIISASSRSWATAIPNCATPSAQFRDEEIEHRDTAIASGAENAAGLSLALGVDPDGLPRGHCAIETDMTGRRQALRRQDRREETA